MIQVKSIADMGAHVSLLEYNNIEDMISFSELSRRRITNVSSLIKVGRQEPVMVIRVDKEKEDIQAYEERYNQSKLVHSIIGHVAETMQLDLEEVFSNFVTHPNYHILYRLVISNCDLPILKNYGCPSKIHRKRSKGIHVLNAAIKACSEAIEQYKGELTVKEAPRAVSERDGKLLAEHMAKLRASNEEVGRYQDGRD
ncbi:hypothetical protein AMTRI_Chr08g204370 [Amborella trichopoda]